MSNSFKCHCCKESKCECALTNDNGQYDHELCKINNDGHFICDKNRVCMCDDPPPYLWKEINKATKEINNNK